MRFIIHPNFLSVNRKFLYIEFFQKCFPEIRSEWLNENAAHQKASEWTADKSDNIVTGTVAAETARVVTGTVKEKEPIISKSH